ncbi:MAG TPA: hypothetical protein PKC21_03415 [Oligoflexia bacterium]|nr:hypothetical protein [Oligoflexia bacterium]HMR24384.1 hypothetical protein [Oligoflexia bacterium]
MSLKKIMFAVAGIAIFSNAFAHPSGTYRLNQDDAATLEINVLSEVCFFDIEGYVSHDGGNDGHKREFTFSSAAQELGFESATYIELFEELDEFQKADGQEALEYYAKIESYDPVTRSCVISSDMIPVTDVQQEDGTVVEYLGDYLLELIKRK